MKISTPFRRAYERFHHIAFEIHCRICKPFITETFYQKGSNLQKPDMAGFADFMSIMHKNQMQKLLPVVEKNLTRPGCML
jgi:hypothetical protein